MKEQGDMVIKDSDISKLQRRLGYISYRLNIMINSKSVPAELAQWNQLSF